MPSIDAVLARAAGAKPSGIAVHEWDTGRQITYAMLNEWASAIAGFMSRHIRPGDRIGVYLPNSAEFIAAAFGGFRAGAVTAYVNYRLLPDEALRQFTMAETRVIVTTSDRAAALLDNPALSHCEFLVTDAPLSTPRRTTLADAVTQLHGPIFSPTGREEEDALLRFTSGTTGAPKGVLVSHRAWLLRAMSLLAEEIRVEAGTMTMVLGPVSHHAGLFVLPTFMRGGTMLLFRQFDPLAIARAVSALPVRRSQMVPTMLRMLMESPEAVAALRGSSSLAEIVYGGSPIDSGVLDAVSQRDPRYRQSAGRPHYAVEIRLRGSNESEWGEIEVRAPWTPRARLTEQGRVAVTEDFVPTGDLGELRDGFIFLKDRANGVIVSGGFNVYPMEIEDAINRCPGILTSAVVSKPDDKWGERVVAFVVARDRSVVDSGALREHCRASLANFKVPKEFLLIDDIPLNPNGKPDRRQLSAPFWEGRERRIN